MQILIIERRMIEAAILMHVYEALAQPPAPFETLSAMAAYNAFFLIERANLRAGNLNKNEIGCMVDSEKRHRPIKPVSGTCSVMIRQ